MKGISAVIILMSIAGASAADAAIRCQPAAGRDQRGVYWSWREIEGKRCWFISAGGVMPPKSSFTWATEEQADNNVPALPEKTKRTAVTIQILTVKPEQDLSDVRANWLDDAPVDIMMGEDLSGTFGVGGSWIVPAYVATAGDTPVSRIPRP